MIYKGIDEASKVPAEWHRWLHYTGELPPSQRPVAHHSWEKEHVPNLTGTAYAYLPPGHVAKGGERMKASADYEPWRP